MKLYMVISLAYSSCATSCRASGGLVNALKARWNDATATNVEAGRGAGISGCLGRLC